MGPTSRSPAAVEAARLLGQRVRLARKGRRMTVAELAERVGVSRTTIQKVEEGDPTVALGTAFEAATLVGVTLFHDEPSRRRLEQSRVENMLALLPESIRVASHDDDF
jgi:transcriptional regulator with XRE-family HTH domain